MSIECVLWDFGDTLVDQDWMLTPHPEVPGWPEAWTAAARGHREEDWCLGRVRYEEIATRISEMLPLSPSDVIAHIRFCCHNVQFFERTMAVALRWSVPQAIVTVNPDVFSELVEPHYQLRMYFPVIVASWQEGTVDKAELCARALDQIIPRGDPGQSILIDNLEANVGAWRARGGHGYVFRGDRQFAADAAQPDGPFAALETNPI